MSARMITIWDLAIERGAVPKDGGLSMSDFGKVDLSITGGCEVCAATITAYNACPSRSGFWRCSSGCIDGTGWTSAAEANRDIFGLVQ